MSEHVVARPSLTLAGAQAVLDAGLEAATQSGVPMGVAVVDAGANLVVFARQDGSPLSCIRLAEDKARTSVDVANSTGSLWDFIESDQALVIGLGADPQITALGGGVPLIAEGTLIGAVGASGGHYSDDAKVAEAAAKALD